MFVITIANFWVFYFLNEVIWQIVLFLQESNVKSSLAKFSVLLFLVCKDGAERSWCEWKEDNTDYHQANDEDSFEQVGRAVVTVAYCRHCLGNEVHWNKISLDVSFNIFIIFQKFFLFQCQPVMIRFVLGCHQP